MNHIPLKNRRNTLMNINSRCQMRGWASNPVKD